MIVVTTNEIEGHTVERVLGLAFGVVVRSRGLGGNILAFLRGLGDGEIKEIKEIKEYTEMLEDARQAAIDRMVTNAHAMGADAVLMVRFDSSEIGQTMAEIVAYGTACVLKEG